MRPGEHGSVFSRFQARQQRGEQFSENIRVVIAGTPGAGGDASVAGARSRSRGLAAGAALALGGGGGATWVESAASKLDADALRRQAVENSRKPTVGRDCPFDNHLAFGAGCPEAALPARLSQLPALAPEEAREAREGAAALAKHLKARQTRVGSSPFDAPETARAGADIAAAPQREDGVRAAALRSRASPAQEAALGEAGAEYARIRARMARGTEDLISGDYDPFGLARGSASQRQPGRRSGLPPQAPPRREAGSLLPQADFNVQYAGADPAGVTRGRAAYLNCQVMAGDNRLRNEHLNVQL